LVADAVRILSEMEQALAAMEVHHAAAGAAVRGFGSTEIREGGASALTHPTERHEYDTTAHVYRF
jgi:hypothetical protein